MIYLLQGCGVSFICKQGKSMLWLIDYMIARGGVPTVQRWQGEAL